MDLSDLRISRKRAADLRSSLASLPEAEDAITAMLMQTIINRQSKRIERLDAMIEDARRAEAQGARENYRSATRAA